MSESTYDTLVDKSYEGSSTSSHEKENGMTWETEHEHRPLFAPAVCGFRPLPFFAVSIVFLEIMNTTITTPSLPDKTKAFFGSVSTASLYNGIFSSIGATIALFVLPIFGDRSDERGRVPFLSITVLCMSLASFALALDVSLWYYVVLSAAQAISSFGLAFSYIADCTSAESRPRWFGYAIGSIFLSFLVGPFLGIAAGSALSSYRLCAGLNVCLFIYVLFVVPESVHHLRDKPARKTTLVSRGAAPGASSLSDADLLAQPALKREKSLNPLASLKYLLRSKTLITIGFVCFVAQIAEQGILQTLLYYVQEKLDFHRKDNTLLLVGDGISCSLSLFFLFPALLKRFDQTNIVRFSLLANAVRIAGICAAYEKWHIYALEALTGISFMVYPALGNMVARLTSAEEQGLGQGSMSGVRGLAK